MDAWAHSRTRQFSSDALVVARSVVTRYLIYLRETPPGSDIIDEHELPAERKTMIQAFRLLIAAENSPRTRAQLVTVGLTLAQFQADIGQRLRLEAVDAADDHDAPEGDVGPDIVRRIDMALACLGPERARLERLFDEAATFSTLRRRARSAFTASAEAYQSF